MISGYIAVSRSFTGLGVILLQAGHLLIIGLHSSFIERIQHKSLHKPHLAIGYWPTLLSLFHTCMFF